jgi:hypothetical protein
MSLSILRSRRHAPLAIVVATCVSAVACRAAVEETGAGEAPLSLSLEPTTPDANNPWMKGVDASHLARGEEVILPNEDETFGEMVGAIKKMQDAMAAKNGGVGRAFHQKPHACIPAELHVTPPAGHPELGVGLFAKEGTYPSWIRLSNGRGITQKDKAPDIQGIALKVMKVPGKKLLAGEEDAVTQDFLAVTSSVQPTADVQQFIRFQTLVTESEVLGNDPTLHLPFELQLAFPGVDFGPLNRMFAQGGFLAQPENRRVASFFFLHAIPGWLEHGSLLGEQFFSGAAIALGLKGDGADPMKAPAREAAQFRFVAGQLEGGTCRPVTKAQPASDDYFRADLSTRLKTGVGCFDLQLQLQRDPSKQFIEDSSVEWREADAPFVSVGSVVVPQGDIETPDVAKRETFCASLGFNPWHTLPEHRPLGNMMRARRVVYEGSREHRGGVGEPTGDEFAITR